MLLFTLIILFSQACPWQSPPRPWPARLSLSCRSSFWRIKKLGAFLRLKKIHGFLKKIVPWTFCYCKTGNKFLFHRNGFKIVLTYAYIFAQWIPKTGIWGEPNESCLRIEIAAWKVIFPYYLKYSYIVYQCFKVLAKAPFFYLVGEFH